MSIVNSYSANTSSHDELYGFLNSDGEYILDQLERGSFTEVKQMSDALRESRPFFRKAITINPEILNFLGADLREDDFFLFDLLVKNPEIFPFLPKKYQERSDFILEAIKKNHFVFGHLGGSLQEALIYQALEINVKVITLLPEELLDNDEFLLSAVSWNPDVILHIDEERKKDYDFIKQAVKINGLILQHLSDFFKDLDDIVGIASIQNPDAFKYAHKRFRNDPEYLKLICPYNFHILKHAEWDLLHDPAFAENIIKAQPEAARYFLEGKASQPDWLVKLALENNGLAYQYLSSEKQMEKRWRCLAMEQNSAAIKFLPREVKDQAIFLATCFALKDGLLQPRQDLNDEERLSARGLKIISRLSFDLMPRFWNIAYKSIISDKISKDTEANNITAHKYVLNHTFE